MFTGNTSKNCSVWPPPCNQLCAESASGPVQCACAVGYNLTADGHHCEPDEWIEGGAFVVFNQGPRIDKKSLGSDAGHEHADYGSQEPSLTTPENIIDVGNDYIGAMGLTFIDYLLILDIYLSFTCVTYFLILLSSSNWRKQESFYPTLHCMILLLYDTT